MTNPVLSVTGYMARHPEFARPVFERLNVDPGDQPTSDWVAAALMHSSFLAETTEVLDGRLLSRLAHLVERLGWDFRDVVAATKLLENEPSATAGMITEHVKAVAPHVDACLVTLLDVEDHLVLGHGQAATAERGSPVRTRLELEAARRLVGVLVLAGRVGLARDLVRQALSGVRLDAALASKVNYKQLLETALKVDPVVEVVAITGPDHDARITVRLTAGRMTSEATARSKKLAGNEAARLLVNRLGIAPSSQPAGVPATIPVPEHLLPASHTRAVHDLCDRFGLDASSGTAFSQALTHTSWASEHRSRGAAYRHQGPLACVGSMALNARLKWMVLGTALRVRGNGDLHTHQDLPADEIVGLLAEVGVDDDAILLGKGQRRVGIPTSVRAEVAQAVVGAALVVQPIATFWTSILPVDAWLTPLAGARVGDANLMPRDSSPRSEFEDLLLACGNLSTDYRSTATGPDHVRRFAAEVVVARDNVAFLAVRGAESSSITAATENAARWMLSVTRALHRKWPARLRERVENDDVLLKLADVTISGALHQPAGTANRLVRHGLVGTRELAAGDYEGFLAWAFDVESLAPLVWGDAPAAKYRAAAAAVGLRSGSPLRELLDRVTTAVAALDLDAAGSVTNSEIYDDLLRLAAIVRLATRPRVSCAIAQAVNEWVLLNRSVVEDVDLHDLPKGALIDCRDGALETLLADVAAAATRNLGTLRIGARGNCLRVVSSVPIPERNPSTEKSSAFLRAELGARRSIADATEMGVMVPLEPTPGEQALIAFADGVLDTLPTPDRLASALHDLKNQLVAAQVASALPAEGRTQALARDIAVSRHLDKAAELAAAIAQTTSLLAPIVVDEVELQSFFRAFIAEKLPALPSRIQLVSNTGDQAADFYTSQVWLRSMLENLYRNAVEAMSDGGVLTIDWIADESTVIVHVRDTGPGLPYAVREAVAKGRPAPSRRPGGSGLGIWTVVEGARRLKGDATVQSSSDGTTWTIVLANLRNDPSFMSEDLDAG